ncbi:NAD(P)-dependent alcohol dehydrogenase [Leucobacter soli]
MKTSIVKRYGAPEIVEVVDRARPEPGAGEVLVRIEAVAVTSGDARIRAGRFPRGFGLPARLALGVRGPRQQVLGTAFSGVIERVGAAVDGFAVGDSIAGMNGARMGAHAQYAAVRPKSMALKPPSVRHVDAAGAVFGGATALHFLRDRVHHGSRVLVNGASGAVGSSAVQLAALAGAEVTAVASRNNHDFVTRLGAHEAIDYAATPLDGISDRFDVVFDTVGNINRRLGLRLAGAAGTVILAVADLAETIRSGGRVLAGSAAERADDIACLMRLLDERKLDPVTETLGGLDRLVDAYRIVDSGRKVGNVVVQPWM